MRKPIPPCLQCKDRVREDPDAGTKDCHNRCEKYLEFRKKLDEYNDMVNRARGEVKLPEQRPWVHKNKPQIITRSKAGGSKA